MRREEREEENARAKRCCGREIPVGHVVHIGTTGYAGEGLLFYNLDANVRFDCHALLLILAVAMMVEVIGSESTVKRFFSCHRKVVFCCCCAGTFSYVQYAHNATVCPSWVRGHMAEE